MNMLRKRLRALESGQPETLSLPARAWLGHTLTAAEKQLVDDGAGRDPRPTDMTGFSQEAKAWLTRN